MKMYKNYWFIFGGKNFNKIVPYFEEAVRSLVLILNQKWAVTLENAF